MPTRYTVLIFILVTASLLGGARLLRDQWQAAQPRLPRSSATIDVLSNDSGLPESIRAAALAERPAIAFVSIPASDADALLISRKLLEQATTDPTIKHMLQQWIVHHRVLLVQQTQQSEIVEILELPRHGISSTDDNITVAAVAISTSGTPTSGSLRGNFVTGVERFEAIKQFLDRLLGRTL